MLRSVMCSLLCVVCTVAGGAAFAQPTLGINGFQSAATLRGQSGRRATFACAATDGRAGSVYGTDTYHDDSAICAAAIHAGMLRPQATGTVTIVMGPGAPSFVASERNGVTSRSYGRSSSSFTFTRDTAAGTIDWTTLWSQMPPGLSGAIVVACPAGGTAQGPIWGTDVYTNDSAICVAAVHAGAIDEKAGGTIAVSRARAPTAFAGSERYGVSSKQWGSSRDAFSVAPASATLAASPTPSATSDSCPLATVVSRTFAAMRTSITNEYAALQSAALQTQALATNGFDAAVLTAQRDALLGEIAQLEQGNSNSGWAACASTLPRTRPQLTQSTSVTPPRTRPELTPSTSVATPVDANLGDSSSNSTPSTGGTVPTSYTDLSTRIGWIPQTETSWAPGGTARYVVVVDNWGPSAVTDAILTVPASVGLSKTIVRCSAGGGGQCPTNPTATQLEAGIVIPSLPVSSRLTVGFEATVTGVLGGSVIVESTIAAPSWREYYAADNTSTQTHAIAPTSAALVGRGGAMLPETVSATVDPVGGETRDFTTLGPCLLPGPVVSVVSVSPAYVHLRWPPIAGATYSVSRADVGPVQGVRKRDGFNLPIEFQESAPFYEGTYQYTVSASYGQGCGSSQVSVVAPRPYLPTARVAFDSGVRGSAIFGVAGAVRPPMDADPNAVATTIGFLVLGPGLPPEGMEIRPSAEQFRYWGCDNLKWDGPCRRMNWTEAQSGDFGWSASVPPGEHAWLVLPFWETDGGRMIDVRYGTRVTLETP